MEIRCTRIFSSKHLPRVLIVLLLPTSTYCLADEPFIPDSNSALNLQAGNAFFIDSAFGMDNQALYDAAENLRNNSMGTVHRRLNHQWLQTHTDPEWLQLGIDIDADEFKPVTGGKALREILKMGWKTYREQNKRAKQSGLSRLERYTNGHGKLGKSMDYDLRLSDDKFNFSVEYEF